MLTSLKRPYWLNKKINLSDCHRIKHLLAELNLNTVCQEANCPNIGECFFRGEATFLILGDTCTRSCSFCAIKKGMPKEIDFNEPKRIAEAVKKLNLKHVVITSVTRDDLEDGGAEIFSQTILSLRKNCQVTIEILIPDFQLDRLAIEKVVQTKPAIIGHNLETVPRLYDSVRRDSDYSLSLGVLRIIKEFDSNIYTKSGLMLGLGETEQEILEVFVDLRQVNCDFLSLGQYLSPSREHFPVQEYISPEKFYDYKIEAQALGFLHVESSPYVRSSYLAGGYINGKKKNKF